MSRKAQTKYRSEYPTLLYRFFIGYEGSGAPSFNKFARSIGVTMEDVELFRSHKGFDRSYRECSEIRRDYLIDNALTRRFDPSFVKYLLSEKESSEGDGELTVTVEVVDK